MIDPALVIFGASTRAAAFSALAAGYVPICADQFADADLAACCAVASVPDFPRDLLEVTLNHPSAPWMYTGGLENYPDLVDRLAERRLLYGNSGTVLRGIRNPWLVQQALHEGGLGAPELRAAPNDLPRDGTWLRKSRRSTGGRGVNVWDAATGHQEPTNATTYFQRFMPGTSCAAVFVAAGGRAQLLGVTEQILLPPRVNSAAFQYAGSIGPLPSSKRRDDLLARVGAALANRFELQGLFGVDFIDDGDTVWPVEVNPRYTASVEILERALGISAVDQHVVACRERRLPQLHMSPPRGWHVKRILYARTELLVTRTVTRAALDAQSPSGESRTTMSAIADIPPAGTHLRAGQPVMTIFSSGATRDAALLALERQQQAWEASLDECRTTLPC